MKSGLWIIIPVLFLCSLLCAQDVHQRSRWSAGFHYGALSNYNSYGYPVTLYPKVDSLSPLDIGLKDAGLPELSIGYEVLHDTGFGLSLETSYGQTKLNFGLVGSLDKSSYHLADATFHFFCLAASVDWREFGLFETPGHSDFLITVGGMIGGAWLSNIHPDEQTLSSLEIESLSAKPELLLGAQARLIWRVFESPWMLSAGGSYRFGTGNDFLGVTTSPQSQYLSTSTKFSFIQVDLGVAYRL